MSFAILELDNAKTEYSRLWKKAKRQYLADPGFDFFYQRLFAGDFLVLRNRFNRQVLCLRDANGQPIALATYYKAKRPDWGQPHSVGAIVLHPELSQEQSGEFAQRVCSHIGQPFVLPMNGHMALGLSVPKLGTNLEKVSFLTSASSLVLQDFFFKNSCFNVERSYLAFQTELSEELEQNLSCQLKEIPHEFTTRPLSLLHFHRDISIYNTILNSSMAKHPKFSPLSCEEEWDIMHAARLLLQPSFFQFLLYKGKEIGFCFGIVNYNQFLRAKNPTILNYGLLLKAKWKASEARIIYSALLPEFQGRGLFKAARHKVMLEMFRKGIKTVESSYIDQYNEKSLGNVKSTGAKLSHSFALLQGNV